MLHATSVHLLHERQLFMRGGDKRPSALTLVHSYTCLEWKQQSPWGSGERLHSWDTSNIICLEREQLESECEEWNESWEIN